jgi:hypothetical protein
MDFELVELATARSSTHDRLSTTTHTLVTLKSKLEQFNLSAAASAPSWQEIEHVEKLKHQV